MFVPHNDNMDDVGVCVLSRLPSLKSRNDHYLEVRDDRPAGALQLQARENELIEGAALLVDQVEQLPVVSPGLELSGEQTEGGVLVDLYPELEVLAEPHHVCGVAAEPPDHPHPHPGGRGRVGHHVRPGRLERDAEKKKNSSDFPPQFRVK